MRERLDWLFTVNSPNEDTQRRGYILIAVACTMYVTALLGIVLTLLGGQQRAGLIAIGAVLVVNAIVIALARRGAVTAGGILLLIILTLSIVGGSAGNPDLSGLMFLALDIVIAGMIFRPRLLWVVLGVVLVTLGAVAALRDPQIAGAPLSRTPLVDIGFLAVFLTMFSYLASRQIDRGIRQAQAARSDAEQAAARLEQSNADLDRRVAERTAELQRVMQELQERAAGQQHLLDEIEQQRVAIRELSVPVLPVSDAVLVMPLVGALDSGRLHDLQEQGLQALQRTKARSLVVDITGVPVVDTAVARGLLDMVTAAQLLGSEVVLVGIRPDVAQSVVGLGLSLSIRTFRDLSTALQTLSSGRKAALA